MTEARARLLEMTDEAEPAFVDPALVGLVDELVARSAAELDVVVGDLVSLGPSAGSFRSDPLGSWVAAAMRRRMRADVGLHNRGGVRKRLGVGPVTRRDLFEVLPFDNTVVAFELTGAELDAVLRGCLDGRQQSRIDVDGMALKLALGGDNRASYLGANVGGMPLDPVRRYRVATNSYLADGGDNVFAGLEFGAVDDSGVLIRDAVEAELAAAGELGLPEDDRYQLSGGSFSRQR